MKTHVQIVFLAQPQGSNWDDSAVVSPRITIREPQYKGKEEPITFTMCVCDPEDPNEPFQHFCKNGQLHPFLLSTNGFRECSQRTPTVLVDWRRTQSNLEKPPKSTPLHNELKNSWIFFQFQRNRRCTRAIKWGWLIYMHSCLPGWLSSTWQEVADWHSKHEYFIAKLWLLPINRGGSGWGGQWEMFIVVLPLHKYSPCLKRALRDKALQKKSMRSKAFDKSKILSPWLSNNH